MVHVLARHDLLAKFYQDIQPSRPNEWEVEELFESLNELKFRESSLLLDQVTAIWPVSHTLCFEFLQAGRALLALIAPDLLPEFVRQLLRLYEKRGLQGTRELIADVEGLFLAPLRGESGVAFESIATRLLHFLRGMSGQSLQIGAAQIPATDTETIFVPSWVGFFPQKTDNEWFYRVVVSLQWSHLFQRVYSYPLGSEVRLPWTGFKDEALARDLFALKRLLLAWRFLEHEFPGLIAAKKKFYRSIVSGSLHDATGASPRQQLMDNLLLAIFADTEDDTYESLLGNSTLEELYQASNVIPGDYRFSEVALMLLGQFDFHRAAEKISLLRKDRETKFVQLAALYLESQQGDRHEGEVNETTSASDSAAVILKQMLDGERDKASSKKGLDSDIAATFPEELLEAARGILDDLSFIPESYFQAAAGLAGAGVNRQEGGTDESDGLIIMPQTWLYDEWDYRRDGYRSDWCVVYEKSLNEVRSDFVQKTLLKYEAPLKRLRRQFEALRTKQRFMRRQRDGDEIDIDALIDSLGDASAGYAPSDRLFVKLLRDDRDITAMFLVDMSNSTEGWVGVALKEALVLLAEALEAAQDRYGIYGFSGMRRSRSEVYKIKAPDEKYTQLTQQRIAGILPMEYTRMGPAIRHICRRLAEEQSRIRILIVLSDGKPEDYDDYKGQYAIEDTRKALLEARGNGIFVFCITIDRTAHDYLEHMFGRGNYIFVEDLTRLPEKMAEMYRLLTS